MATLLNLRKDLEFTGEMADMVDVFKGVAIAQFRHLHNRRGRFEVFGHYLDEFFRAVYFDRPPHPFIVRDISLPRALVMITSDEGFLGEFNSSVVNFALTQRKTSDELIVLGERGSRYLEEMQESFIYFPGVSNEIAYGEAKKLRDYLTSQYMKKKIGEVAFVYARFVSFGMHEVGIFPLLPCDFLFEKEEKEGKKKDGIGAIFKPEDMIEVEPSTAHVIDYIVRIWLVEKIHDIFWESKLSEWAARVIHMEGSSQELGRLEQKLSFQYFRLIHEISDKNIREIFASRSLWRR